MITRPKTVGGFLAALLALGLGYWAFIPADAPDAGTRIIEVSSPPTKVIDGDTFEADLNGDGRLEFPRERVRLLYVDTPELRKSHKGWDVRRGRKAKAFLKAMLQPPLLLLIREDMPFGRYGRTLAVVVSAGKNVNLALVRAGHSYFMTRFAYSEQYAEYAAAEGKAFDAKTGIWSSASSRKKYLKRLKKELKTPAGASNSPYFPTVLTAGGFDPAQLEGKYVRVLGRVASLKTLSKGVMVLTLNSKPGGPALQVVAYPKQASRLGVEAWTPGREVAVEGFIKAYKGRFEMALHYGYLL